MVGEITKEETRVPRNFEVRAGSLPYLLAASERRESVGVEFPDCYEPYFGSGRHSRPEAGLTNLERWPIFFYAAPTLALAQPNSLGDSWNRSSRSFRIAFPALATVSFAESSLLSRCTKRRRVAFYVNVLREVRGTHRTFLHRTKPRRLLRGDGTRTDRYELFEERSFHVRRSRQ